MRNLSYLYYKNYAENHKYIYQNYKADFEGVVVYVFLFDFINVFSHCLVALLIYLPQSFHHIFVYILLAVRWYCF